MALSNNEQFLPANQILIKAWIKLGFKFKAISIIKNLWKTKEIKRLLDIESKLICYIPKKIYSLVLVYGDPATVGHH